MLRAERRRRPTAKKKGEPFSGSPESGSALPDARGAAQLPAALRTSVIRFFASSGGVTQSAKSSSGIVRSVW